MGITPEEICKDLKDKVKEIEKCEKMAPNQLLVTTSSDKICEVIEKISNDYNAYHLSTISAVDLGKEIELNYHLFSYKYMVDITVRCSIPKDNPRIKSIIDVIPGAILYEMEVHDLFGVYFEGNPNMNERLILPEDWPEDLPPPLWKDVKTEELRKRLYKQ